MHARISDAWAIDARVVTAGDAAFGVLCRLMCWTAGSGTDGFVPDAIAGLLIRKRELLAVLEAHRFVERVAEGEVRRAEHRIGGRDDVRIVMPGDGFWLVDYLVHNVTAAEGRVLTERGRKAGQASGAARRAQQQVEQQVQQQAEPQAEPALEPSSPVRSRPEQTTPAMTDENGKRSHSDARAAIESKAR